MQNSHWKNVLLQATSAQEAFEMEMIQELWSGYGEIKRVGLKGASVPSVVVKHVRIPQDKAHPRGWNSQRSHERKIKSYAVETAWYARWSQLCVEACHVPQCYACESLDNDVFIVLEDLDAAGYSQRRSSLNFKDVKVCLKWLAHFHATFMGIEPKGLWPVGTYWHLDTRPDELKVMKDKALKNAAQAIDQKLNASQFMTFVHGDAKLANFCFTPDGKRVAAVDFQYVGGGCGMKDVAYFMGSCMDEEACERLEGECLEYYFEQLIIALNYMQKDIDSEALEKDWRSLYPVAWTDFHRFIKGWSPGHWKINDYSERLARRVVEGL